MAVAPLQVQDLSTTLFTRRGTMKAVDGLSLRVGAGETVALVGESGCGKSLSALSIMRLLPDPPARITAGKVTLNGRDLVPLPEPSVLTVTAWTKVWPCSCPTAGAVGLEKISTTYDVFGASFSAPESVPVPPGSGVKLSVGGLTDWLGELGVICIPPAALSKIELRLIRCCPPPLDSIPKFPLCAITLP